MFEGLSGFVLITGKETLLGHPQNRWNSLGSGRHSVAAEKYFGFPDLPLFSGWLRE